MSHLLWLCFANDWQREILNIHSGSGWAINQNYLSVYQKNVSWARKIVVALQNSAYHYK